MNANYVSTAIVMGIAGLCVGFIPLGNAQPGQPTQPPSNPQQPAAPKAPPANNPPVQPVVPPGTKTPNTPVNPNTPSDSYRTKALSDVADPNTPDRLKQPKNRNMRPFAFQNPTDEVRFNDASQKLVRMEQRSEQSNLLLLKRLGEIRRMSPDRQSESTMDLLQQMLKSQTDMQQYLVSSRALWTGDVDLSGQPTDGDTASATQDQQPAAQQPPAPQQPRAPR
ncbi:MAG: hypothetical protein NTV94_07355 [Planctomycetota bacterium]|nr:hypothetical protein [Planctomycetota bacterium]